MSKIANNLDRCIGHINTVADVDAVISHFSRIIREKAADIDRQKREFRELQQYIEGMPILLKNNIQMCDGWSIQDWVETNDPSTLHPADTLRYALQKYMYSTGFQPERFMDVLLFLISPFYNGWTFFGLVRKHPTFGGVLRSPGFIVFLDTAWYKKHKAMASTTLESKEEV